MQMKRILLIISAIICLSITSNGFTSTYDTIKGAVVYDGSSNYHIVSTDKYYVIVEWYSGPDFSKGDNIIGELHSYGFKMVKINGKSNETKVYIENYWPRYETCYEWLKEHNRL